VVELEHGSPHHLNSRRTRMASASGMDSTDVTSASDRFFRSRSCSSVYTTYCACDRRGTTSRRAGSHGPMV